MGSGKTAVGRQLSKRFGMEFVDSDQEVERRTGVDIPYIFDKEGEAGFRCREKEVIEDLTQRHGIVLATGGGVVLDAENRAHLSVSGLVIYLDTSVDEQLRRTAHTSHRPLLLTEDPRATLEKIRIERRPLYEEVADIKLDTTGRRVRSVALSLHRLIIRKGFTALQSS